MKKPAQHYEYRSILGRLDSFVFLLTVFAILLIGALAPVSAARAATSPGDGQPALIDRELFFGDPEIIGGQISPDGQFIAFIKPYNGTRNIWVKRTGEPFTAARPITNETKRPIPAYLWSRDGKYILSFRTKPATRTITSTR